MKRAAALTAELAAQSEKKTAVVCDQPPGLDELAGHIEAPNMGAGCSHPQATLMPDPWATYRCPSAEEGQTANNAPPETSSRVSANKGALALPKGFREARSRSATRNVETRSMVDEALDFYVKAYGKDGTQKRERLVNMRPGELRRCLERWQARATEVQRLQEKKEQAWDLYSRVPSFGRKKKENFERDLGHKAMRNGKIDEKSLQEWTDEMQSKVQAAIVNGTLGREANGDRRLQLPTAPNFGEARGNSSFLHVADDRIYDIFPFAFVRNVLGGFQVHLSILFSLR